MPVNEAAWILEAKGDLHIQPTPYPVPEQNEIVIKVCNVC
jgi:D-arabinose 1-dehydrogenase-like Zn-dependent alcohol dehydrogenase